LSGVSFQDKMLIMAGMLDKFREEVVANVWKSDPYDHSQGSDLNDKIALGVLMWVVAESDNQFLPQEKKQIEEVLVKYGKISEEEIPYILASIEKAAVERIDLHTFTKEVKEDLPYKAKLEIVDDLFRVACADDDLDHQEQETIRKIAGLLGIDHKEFIDAKIKIKNEFGIATD